MDGKKIQIVLEILQAGSMLKASEALGYTPSGLAHLVDSVEQELGVRIFQRGRFGVRLTGAGEALLPKLQAFADAEQQLYSEAARQNKTDVLRIGAYASIAQSWLPGIIADFRRAWPEVQIDMSSQGGAEELYLDLLQGRRDMVFMAATAKNSNQFIHLYSDRFYAVLPKESPEEGSFRIQNFAIYPFIVPSLGKDPDVSLVMEGSGVKLKVLATTADDPVVISMVSAGLGVSMLSELVLKGLNTSKVKCLPLEPPAYRQLGVAVRDLEELRPTEKEFIQYIRSSPALQPQTV